MADWDQALDALVELNKFNASDIGTKYIAGFVHSFGRKLYDVASGEVLELKPDEVREEDLESMRSFAFNIVGGVRKAEPIWVTEDVVDLVNYAAESFEPEPLVESDLLVPEGFVLLERPFFWADRHGKKMGTRAISWTQIQVGWRGKEALETKPGVLVGLYSHCDDVDDYDQLPPIGPYGHLQLNHMVPIVYGSDSDLRLARGKDGDPALRSSFELYRSLQAFWRLSQQEIISPRWMRAGRPARRRAEREFREISEVSVCTLRRMAADRHREEGDSEVDWSHRWMVSGHWRWQPYKADKPEEATNGEVYKGIVYRQIWIAPYVKGPDSKPLIMKQRVFDFRR